MPLSLPFMPRYDDGDSKNPDNISWFEDNPYNDRDSDNPYFDDSPAYSGVKDSYHPDNISWFKDNPYDNGDSDNPYHLNEYSALPNKEWVPAPPDLSSFNALSQHSSHCSSLSLHALLSHCDAHRNHHPDPDGIDSSLAHHSFYHPVVVAVVVAVAVVVVVVVA